MAAGANRLQALLSQGVKPIIGMVHVRPTLASHRYRDPHSRLVEEAVQEAVTLVSRGVHSVLIENMHDVPYQRAEEAGPELSVSMTTVAMETRRRLPDTPLGVQILSGCNRAALAVAKATDLDFVRAEGFVFAHIGDEGLTQSCAADLLRYRRQLFASSVWLLADVKKKHSSHAITADTDLAETCRAAKFFLADALVVTGRATGCPTVPADVAEAAAAGQPLPVFVGSGASASDLAGLWAAADGFIVGSALKAGGRWENAVEPRRVDELVREHSRLAASGL
uniref:BtpA family membrane complex biogenesis protein n=2 Tax=Macrostomum lignano TaxID=282301 RepID=A0A1I8I8Q4_9PLAT